MQRLIERGAALALATFVTLGLLGGIDALATHDVQAGSLLVRQADAAGRNS
jgi:hypothetical protein